MRLIYNKIFLEHDTGMHPENKKRLASLRNVKETKIKDGKKYLELIHSKEYIKRVRNVSKRSDALDSDTVTSKRTFKVATYAVGATVMASESKSFAIVRPPGHHAYPNKSSGFCIFNNIAIATQKLVNEGKKVLIFDFDSHCGDGTEDIFYDTNKVFYFSIHQYPAFPNKGWVDDIGSGKGKGYTLNIPLPPKSGDDIFKDAIKKSLPVLKNFKPDVVAISAGFDGHQDDLLLDLKLSYNSFYFLGDIIRKNFDNYFATLEGGYNIYKLPFCIASFLEGISGEKNKTSEALTKSPKEVKKEYEKRMKKIQNNLRRYYGAKKN